MPVVGSSRMTTRLQPTGVPSQLLALATVRIDRGISAEMKAKSLTEFLQS